MLQESSTAGGRLVQYDSKFNIVKYRNRLLVLHKLVEYWMMKHISGKLEIQKLALIRSLFLC